MAKQKPQDIQKQIDEFNKTAYGDETISGHTPDPESDDDTSQALEDVLGNSPKHDENIGDEINKDEQAILEKPINDYKSEEPTESLSDVPEAEVPDPYDLLTDADFKKKK